MLFICKANVGRSQMAEAIFNTLAAGKAVAISAGVDPKRYEGHRLSEVGPNVTKCMKEIGIDVSSKKSKRIKSSMVDEADIVISMVDKNMLPEYVRGLSKVAFWKIDDPEDMGYEGHVKIRNIINKKVSELAKELGLV